MIRLNYLHIEQVKRQNIITMRQHSFLPAPIPPVLRPSNSSDHQAKANPKPPLGPVGLRGQEGPERVQAHTNDGGNRVQSVGA